MPKKITVQSGTVYNSLSAAKAYYNALRKATEIGKVLSEPDRSDVLDIYHQYCQITSHDKGVLDAVDVVAMWDNRPRAKSQYAPTKAFAVVDTAGKSSVFSIAKALEAIAI